MICPSSVSRFMLAPLLSPLIKIHQKHVVAREARRLKNQPTVGDSYYTRLPHYHLCCRVQLPAQHSFSLTSNSLVLLHCAREFSIEEKKKLFNKITKASQLDLYPLRGVNKRTIKV